MANIHDVQQGYVLVPIDLQEQAKFLLNQFRNATTTYHKHMAVIPVLVQKFSGVCSITLMNNEIPHIIGVCGYTGIRINKCRFTTTERKVEEFRISALTYSDPLERIKQEAEKVNWEDELQGVSNYKTFLFIKGKG